MVADNKANEHAPNAEVRIRESMQATLAKKFYDLMSNYQELKAKNATKYRDRVRHQVEVASGNKPTEDELDEILEAGDTNRLFAAKILADKRHDDAANALIFIKDRHNDILKLEKSINELYQIFLDMATLVETQGEMIDQIEFQVSKSVEYTDEAVKQLVKASAAAKRSRKKIVIIILLCLCLLAIIGLALGLALGIALPSGSSHSITITGPSPTPSPTPGTPTPTSTPAPTPTSTPTPATPAPTPASTPAPTPP